MVYEHMVIDITRVTNPHRRQLDNTLHVDGERLLTTGGYTPCATMIRAIRCTTSGTVSSAGWDAR
ncbi:hypothetical protein LNO81_31230 [Klebsiella variicola subsp. variicola]|nr:hypothetical protein [Klebsiella variicola subsp. variicola]